MVVKFVNPLTDGIQISEFSSVHTTNDVDESGNSTSGYIMMFTLKDAAESILMVGVDTFNKCVEYMDTLYKDEKIDFSSDANVSVHVYSELLETGLSELLDSLEDGETEDIDFLD